MQLTVAAVTPPAEHAARRPAGAADAAAADAGVIGTAERGSCLWKNMILWKVRNRLNGWISMNKNESGSLLIIIRRSALNCRIAWFMLPFIRPWRINWLRGYLMFETLLLDSWEKGWIGTKLYMPLARCWRNAPGPRCGRRRAVPISMRYILRIFEGSQQKSG